MTLVSFNSVGKYYGTQDVLSEVNFKIQSGEKIGLVGANGAGKTTLVRILIGEEEPTAGSVSKAAELRTGYIPQIVECGDSTVRDFLLGDVIALERTLREAEADLATAGQRELGGALARYQSARDRFDGAGGDNAESKASAVLEALGLPGTFDRPVSTLSGGEKNVLALARAVLARPDLLVLDEPGNHLDYVGLAWLEKYLSNYPGAVLIVSHNRYLLDRTTDRTFELRNARLAEYEGNYSRYRMTKLRNALAQQADYRADRKKLDRLEALVKRFEEIARRTADPAWGKRLHSRKTQLKKTQESAAEKPEGDAPAIRIALKTRTVKADIAVQVNGYTRKFGERVLFENASLEIACGERVALVGPNGSGKSTFLNDLLSQASWDHPVFRIGPSLKTGYCAQNQETLNHGRSILDEFMSLGAYSEQQVHSFLTPFLFTRADLSKRIGDLSGGEKNRLQLAKVIVTGADFLVLDEPTNHMDIPSREALEDALADFNGTVLAVTHDRYFLDKIATVIVEIADRRFSTFYGNFSEFWAEKQASVREMSARVETRGKQHEKTASPGNGISKSGAAAKEIERRIMELEREKSVLERGLSEAFSRGDYREGRRLSDRLDDLGKRIEKLYAEWGAD